MMVLLETFLLALLILVIIFFGVRIMSGLTDMQAAVAAQTTSVAAAVTAIQALAGAGDSDAQVGALAATVAQNNAALDAAVAAAQPAPTPPATPQVGS